jgi:hypothetical protein
MGTMITKLKDQLNPKHQQGPTKMSTNNNTKGGPTTTSKNTLTKAKIFKALT